MVSCTQGWSSYPFATEPASTPTGVPSSPLIADDSPANLESTPPVAVPAAYSDSPPSIQPLPGSPDRYSVEPEFPALEFDRLIEVIHRGDGLDRLFAVIQTGQIVSFPADPAAASTNLVIDISDRVSTGNNEEGLLGLAFDPQYSTNGHFFVYYSAANPRRSVVSRFTVVDGVRSEVDSEVVILEVDQPFGNHNGGQLAFGPDGFLYIGLGDGGSAGDPHGNGQNLATLLGSILRIDVAALGASGSYAIPPDNPFVGDPNARGEIWAYGLRNPWRFTFDRETGDLWTGDVGQNAYEEVDLIAKGSNSGWNIMEGDQCFRASECDQTGLARPIATYGRADGCSITGGYVYRGGQFPALYGAYIYGDFCSGKIWALRHDGQRVSEAALIADTDLAIASFARGGDGEIYVLPLRGSIHRLVHS